MLNLYVIKEKPVPSTARPFSVFVCVGGGGVALSQVATSDKF